MSFTLCSKFVPYIVFISLVSCDMGSVDKKDKSKTENSVTLSNFNLADKVFNTGGGLSGYFIRFYGNGTFEEFGFCDICPGSGTIGTYDKDSRAIYMLDSVCYVNEPHFTDSSVFVNCEGSTMSTYYLIQQGNTLYLSSNASDTIDSCDVQIDSSYPSYKLNEPKGGLTNLTTN
jgi:hypothetical protein